MRFLFPVGESIVLEVATDENVRDHKKIWWIAAAAYKRKAKYKRRGGHSVQYTAVLLLFKKEQKKCPNKWFFAHPFWVCTLLLHLAEYIRPFHEANFG